MTQHQIETINTQYAQQDSQNTMEYPQCSTLLLIIIKCLTNCARCDWSVQVYYSSIKHAAYVTRVLYQVIMHAAYVTSLSMRDFLSIL